MAAPGAQPPPAAPRTLEGADLVLWAEACRFWDASIALRPPEVLEEGDDVAYIDLSTRTTRVHLALLEAKGLRSRLRTVLAHEVGHHIRWPRTLLLHRRLLAFLREEIPAILRLTRSFSDAATPLAPAAEAGLAASGAFDYLVNLDLDLAINDDMVREDPGSLGFQEDFIALYRRLVTDAPGPASAVMAFYAALYEEMWFLPRGTLVSSGLEGRLTGVRATWREEAADLTRFLDGARGRLFRRLAKVMLAFAPYLLADGPKQRGQRAVLEGGAGVGGELTAGDLAAVLSEDAEAQDARSLLRPEEAAGKSEATAGSRGGTGRAGAQGSAFPRLDALRGLVDPGEAALAWYRNAARRVALELPRSLTPGEPFVPGPSERWEPGDDWGAIDWRETLAKGAVAIPGVTTRRRTWFADEPKPGDATSPWIEIYVDSSGSMPNPLTALNPQVLAGFALVRCAVEAGGRARVVQYSGAGQVKAMDAFSASALPAERALLQYIGGGTSFPFSALERSVTTWRPSARVFRVVLSDGDFIANTFLQKETGCALDASVRARLALLTKASDGGDRVALLLVTAVGDEHRIRLERTGAEVILAPDRSRLHGLAEELGRRLFAAEGERAPPPGLRASAREGRR